ncbi:MAG: ribonuclease E/G [Sarcina sp.]
MREIFIERRENILRLAIKENKELTECYIEENNNEPVSGELYKGIVKRIVPSINAAFIDIGYEKDAYMSLDKKMSETLKVGHELVVEVLKEEIGKKAAKVTNVYSIAGNYLVVETRHKSLVISRKIKNRGFEKEIKSLLEKPEEIGVTIRTKAENAGIYEIQKELKELYEVYLKLVQKCKYELKPGKLYDNNSLMNRIKKDFINDETTRIVLDSKVDFELMKSVFVDSQINIELHNDMTTLFAQSGIEKSILSLRNNKVNLKCGGNIVIEKTEAMYAIDINSAKNSSSSRDNTTADITNIEAAKEIAKQIKLRNISGIIVIDFIESYNELAKEKVINILKKELSKDKQKSKVYDFTELGLVQIARARRGKSIYDFIEEKCSRCKGQSVILKLSYIYLLIKNEILRWDLENGVKDFHITLNKIYENDVKEDIFRFLKEINALDLNIYLTFEAFDEFYKVEPLLFKNQIENVKDFLVKNIEKY